MFECVVDIFWEVTDFPFINEYIQRLFKYFRGYSNDWLS